MDGARLWAMRDLIKYCKRKGLLIELGGEAILVIRSDLARKLAPLKTHYLIRICYARYADDSQYLLMGYRVTLWPSILQRDSREPEVLKEWP
ncbi:hypothetical protein L484_019455 [Morus notabilis]|uniref:Uncharacterized protein n=1 Tax=Morus notabilis TaxID=981085 RepID=W9S4V5_9ROSA|nr:hypothetical protein L484_019455 [Morus notabilis]